MESIKKKHQEDECGTDESTDRRGSQVGSWSEARMYGAGCSWTYAGGDPESIQVQREREPMWRRTPMYRIMLKSWLTLCSPLDNGSSGTPSPLL